ncbi:MAG: histidine phosphatase family protein, partial [Mycobacterium sp.]
MTETEKTVVHVMRHGEVHNPDKILYGRLPDYHLSERGQAQARAVGDWLAHRNITHVVASPLERAQE